ncbi:hypothetical protein GF327_05275 [Candidatus Woesearchaeota archaeon]|nr:hypothetical protein [Candidatus Woesearchaeota archaeon]
MTKENPFDLLLIESPYEYYTSTRDKYGQLWISYKTISLRELGEICELFQIPVKVIYGMDCDPYGSFSRQHRAVMDYFDECDYDPDTFEPDIEDFILENTSRGEQIKILVTGGIFEYENPHESPETGLNRHANYFLEKIIEQERDIGKDNLLNYYPNDPNRKYAIPWGCVPAFAGTLFLKIEELERVPLVYIDTKSVVSHSLKSNKAEGTFLVDRVVFIKGDEERYIDNRRYIIARLVDQVY